MQAIWKDLKTKAPGLLGTERIKWNFTKFLVARDGVTVQRFSPSTQPLSMVEQIEMALAHNSLSKIT